jgi:hypothetical protein
MKGGKRTKCGVYLALSLILSLLCADFTLQQ